jgi:hypothetical protein
MSTFRTSRYLADDRSDVGDARQRDQLFDLDLRFPTIMPSPASCSQSSPLPNSFKNAVIPKRQNHDECLFGPLGTLNDPRHLDAKCLDGGVVSRTLGETWVTGGTGAFRP